MGRTAEFSLVVVGALFAVSALACGGPSEESIGGSEADFATCAKAGRLTLYAIPPPMSLDWSTPNRLFATAATSLVAGKALVGSGKAALGHEIGHVNVELDCGASSIPLTGQTGGGNEWKAGFDGFGIVLRDYPGSLTGVPGKDHDEMARDIELRQESGQLTRISFTVNAAMCTRLKAFHDEYVARAAQKHYSGIFRARRFEGAGCAVFGAAFVDVGGLLRRSLITPAWSRSLFIGSSRYSNFLGKDRFYAYGSNTVARDASGASWIWPDGVNLPASIYTARVPGSALFDAWTGPEDKSFGIASLPKELDTKVPFSLYDPELMTKWAEGVWQEASKSGSASSLGAKWTASTVGGSHEITYDASCVAPQTIPFDADNDDLFKDSDSP